MGRPRPDRDNVENVTTLLDAHSIAKAAKKVVGVSTDSSATITVVRHAKDDNKGDGIRWPEMHLRLNA
jgi:hypothetical protein